MEELLEFRKNIISWYPIEKNNTVLQIGKDDVILEELKTKSNNVVTLEKIEDFELKAKFDYVTIIGSLENLNSEEEIIEIIKLAKSCLNKDGKILLAMRNKFGMKYWTGEKILENSEAFFSIVKKTKNILSFNGIRKILDELKLDYKFYYPLPDYKITNVIFSDEFMPSNDSIDARDLTFCKDDELLVFSEREAYKQLLEKDSNMFPFFANSYFIEIGIKEKFEDIKYVSYGITRKKEYRIKTIIRKENVFKTENNSEAITHIKNISRNIDILNNCKIECLDKYSDGTIISKFLKDSISYDELLIDIYNQKGIDETVEKILEFKKEILDKLGENLTNKDKTVFEKYDIQISKELKDKLHFTRDGIIDLIFQNCLVKGNKIFAYDQEWYEENVPIEFILYRAVFYFTEFKKKADINELYEKLNLKEFIEVFEELENKIQNSIIDENIWNLHMQSTTSFEGSSNIIENYKNQVLEAQKHSKELEDVVEEYKKQIEELNGRIGEKDIQLENYANELRAIANSLSWKITKPIRSISGALHKKK